MVAKKVGIRNLRLRGREIVERAKAGETIQVTDRGRPVAQLGPLDPEPSFDEMVAQGLIQPAVRDLDEVMDELGLPVDLGGDGPSLSELIRAERDSYYSDPQR